MNLVEAEVQVYLDRQRADRLFEVAGHECHVEYGETGIATMRLQVLVEEARPLDNVVDAAAKLKAYVDAVRVRDRELEEEEFSVSIKVEELIAIAGNQHRRGEIVP